MDNYRIRLASDAEILQGAVTVYTKNHMTINDTSLDSTFFGANATANKPCSICGQDVFNCPGHYSVIQLPIPIPVSLTCKQLIALISSICPICAKILLPEDELKKIRLITASDRLILVRNMVNSLFSRMEGAQVCCPNCGNMISSPITTRSTTMPDLLFYVKDPSTTEWVVVNPIEVQTNLFNFDQLEEVGFSESFHPKNFMTSIIPILPSKLRAKGIHNESALTSYYSTIIEKVNPGLENIKSHIVNKNSIAISEEKLKLFINSYSMLQAYYMLITNVESDATTTRILNVIGKQHNLRFDSDNCCFRRFKGKDRSIFTKGIIDMIHGKSARVVLGCGPDVSNRELIVPYNIANRLMFYYPVYDVNVNFIKSLLIKMNDTSIRMNQSIPKVMGIWQHGRKSFCEFDPNKAASMAELLMPGDWIALTVCNGDMVMQTRHPANIEESLTTFRVVKRHLPVVGMTLPVCKCKAADFDGDEIQLFLLSGHWTDISALLLHTSERQARSFKTGAFSFYFNGQHDDYFGIKRFGNYSIKFYNHEVIPNGINILKIISDSLPRDLNYESSTLKIVNGVVDPNKYNMMDKGFYQFIHSVYGPKRMIDTLDTVELLSYDVNKCLGTTFGYEIRFHGNDEQFERIEELRAMGYEEAKQRMKKTGVMDQSVVNCIESKMPEIKQILLDSSKGRNFDKLGLTKDRTEEYAAMIVQPAVVRNEEGFVTASLADGMRPSGSAYRFSFDPHDYGCFDRGFAFDADPITYQFAAAAEELAIYQKFAGTARQGYFANRLGITYGRAYLDHNGCIVDGRRLIGTQYGMCGLDSRHVISIPLPDITLDRDEFTKVHKSKRLLELFDKFHNDTERYGFTTSFLIEKTSNNLVTGVDFEQLFRPFESEKGSTEDEIDKFIIDMYDIFIPNALRNYLLEFERNFERHEYYFRIRLERVKMNKEFRARLLNCIRFMLGDAGDPIGMKSALAASEPLTQASLNAIHHGDAGGADMDLVVRATGIKAFEQRLAGARVGNENVLTIRLFKDDRESTRNFALEQETFFFNEIYAVNEIRMRRSIPQELIDIYGEVVKSIPISPIYVKSIWNVVKFSQYRIRISEIIDGLMKQYPEIVMILPTHLNSRQITAYIYFSSSMDQKGVHEIVNGWSDPTSNNVVHGGLLKNCYVRENANREGHYVIECNESIPKSNTFETIIFDPRVDPQTSLDADPNNTYSMYGIFESSARVYDSLLYASHTLSDTKELMQRVYKTIASVMSVSGGLIFATKPSLSKDLDNDLLKDIKFQGVEGFLTSYAMDGGLQQFDEWVPSAVLQQQPGFGEGISKIIIH